MTRAHKFAWCVLTVTLFSAAAFLAITSRLLPPQVAVHFDESGSATSFLPVASYCRILWILGTLLPLGIVVALHATYSRVVRLRLPHADYWMAAPRLTATRAYLKTHGTWLGVLLVLLMSFMHWLIVSANTLQPPQLATQTLLVGSVVVLLGMAAWISTLMSRFRRPA